MTSRFWHDAARFPSGEPASYFGTCVRPGVPDLLCFGARPDSLAWKNVSDSSSITLVSTFSDTLYFPRLESILRTQ
ncbi:MAG: hypothetical protein AB7U97_16190, partial [Pirellulales bacterium]